MVDTQDYSTREAFVFYKDGATGEICEAAKCFLAEPEIKKVTNLIFKRSKEKLNYLFPGISPPCGETSLSCLKTDITDSCLKEVRLSVFASCPYTKEVENALWVIREGVLSSLGVDLTECQALNIEGAAELISSLPEQARDFVALGESWKGEGHVYPAISTSDGSYLAFSSGAQSSTEPTQNGDFFITTEEGVILTLSCLDLIELGGSIDPVSGKPSKQKLNRLIGHIQEVAQAMGLVLSDEAILDFRTRIENSGEELRENYIAWQEMRVADECEKRGFCPFEFRLEFFSELSLEEEVKRTRMKAMGVFITIGARKPPRQQIITVRPSHRPTRQRTPRSHHRVAVSVRGGDSGDDESGESDPPAPPLSWRSCPYHRLPSHNPQPLEPLQPFPCGDVSRDRYRRRSFVVDFGRWAA